MHYFFGLFLAIIFCIHSQAQIVLPKIDSDDIKISQTETSFKKEYFKAGKLIVEVFYPTSQNKLEDHCGRCHALGARDLGRRVSGAERAPSETGARGTLPFALRARENSRRVESLQFAKHAFGLICQPDAPKFTGIVEG